MFEFWVGTWSLCTPLLADPVSHPSPAASTQQQIARDGGVHLLLASMWRHFDKVALMEVVSNCLWGLAMGQGTTHHSGLLPAAALFVASHL